MSKNLILSRKELKPSSFSIRNPLQMHMSNTTYKKKEYNIENKIILSNDFYFDKDAKTIESESIKDTTTNLYFSARKDNLNQKTITLYKCNDTHPIDEKEIEIFDIKDNIGLSLKKFTKKLTDIDKIKKTDPVVGRTDEIKRVIQILCRRSKNNPILLGEPGVGKTAVTEGLAQRIVNKQQIPKLLKNKQLYSLNIGHLVAGTSYRGQFEKRLKDLVDDIKSNKDNILVIDEIHLLIGAGSGEGSMDAAQLLKPSLARGELQVIGATTIDEFRKYIEPDAALERRLQSVQVKEPNIQETVLILKGLKPLYEKYHNLTYTEDAITAAATLSSQFVADRFLPDKAIDLLDESGSYIKIKNSETNISQKQLKRKSITVDEIKSINSLFRVEKQTTKKVTNRLLTVSDDNISEIISTWTGVPMTKLSDDETEKLINMEENLHKRIIGQDQAVVSISKAIRRARTGLRDPDKPIASFIFAGPTGVGKTELTKALAAYFFDSEEKMVRLDMSEFMERHTVSKIIGSPPGYVGYNEGGQLTEAIRRTPYTVVLFDEIEKAHPDVFNLLLQILDDGRLTDSKGRLIDFKNTLIILTSNIGAKTIEKITPKTLKKEDNSNNINKELTAYKLMASLVQEDLKTFFKPEFLNRLDEIIIFKPLTVENVQNISQILINQLTKRVESQGYSLIITSRMIKQLIFQGFNPIYGARPLRRAVTDLLEDTLANGLIGVTKTKDSRVLLLDFDENSKKGKLS